MFIDPEYQPDWVILHINQMFALNTPSIRTTGKGWGCTSVVEHFPGMHKALNSSQHWKKIVEKFYRFLVPPLKDSRFISSAGSWAFIPTVLRWFDRQAAKQLSKPNAGLEIEAQL